MAISKKYNSTKREPVVKKMQTLLQQLHQHHQYLKATQQKLKQIEKDIKAMDEYYFTDWINDYTHFSSSTNYTVLSQDHIHEALQNLHQQKINLLKQIVKHIL